MADIFDLSDTWNDGGTTYSAFKMNVTDTASAAASLLMNLQVGSDPKFQVSKNGTVTAGSSAEITFAGSGEIYAIKSTGTGLSFQQKNGGTVAGAIRAGGTHGLHMRNNYPIGWVPSSVDGTAPDLMMFRDAADTMALRRSTNAQTQRWYETYTDSSNYSRGYLSATSTAVTLGSQAAGTGTKRNVVLDGANRAAYSETPADLAAVLVSHGLMNSPA